MPEEQFATFNLGTNADFLINWHQYSIKLQSITQAAGLLSKLRGESCHCLDSLMNQFKELIILITNHLTLTTAHGAEKM